MRYIIGFAVCATVALSSGARAPIPKGEGKPTLMFPTKVGQKWVYLYSDPAKKEKDTEVVESVTEAEVRDGITRVLISRLHTDGEMYPNRVLEVSEKGVIRPLSEPGKPPAPPWVYLKLPHKTGQSWEGPGNKKYTSFGPEKVTVPAGEYEAIRVEERESDKPDSAVIQTNWYAPGVGIVKITTKKVVVVLKSFKQPE